MAHHRLGAAQLAKLGEQMEQPRVHFFIGIDANPAIATIRQPGRQRHPQLASRRLLRSPQEGDAFRTALLGPSELRAASRVRTRLLAGGKGIRTLGPSLRRFTPSRCSGPTTPRLRDGVVATQDVVHAVKNAGY